MVSQPTRLRSLLEREGCLTLPGVYDGISARMARTVGFEALYMTGYGVVASALGVADAGVATFTEMLDRVRCIAGAVTVPFIADGDTGYGGLLNVDRTVRGYAAAGASGIQIEDQEFPKKCGHTEFRRVIPAEDAVAKIRVAVDARPDRDFLIVARTDARYSEGLDEALRRADLFLHAGADILFVESPESPEELRRVAERFRGGVLLANMVEGGRTPYLSAEELGVMGFKIALYPGTGFLTAAGALQLAYRHLHAAGIGTGSGGADAPLCRDERPNGLPRRARVRAAVWATARGGGAGRVTASAAFRLDRLPILPFHRRLLWLIGAGMFFDSFDIYLAGSVLGELVHNGWSSVPLNARFISGTFVGMVIGALAPDGWAIAMEGGSPISST